jgi:hypothetical protein
MQQRFDILPVKFGFSGKFVSLVRKPEIFRLWEIN